MNTVILAISQKWQDEELVRDTLRKLHRSNPAAVLRLPDPVSGTGKEAREFADALGFKIEKCRSDSRWPKYAAEIRLTEMITGYVIDPLTGSVTVKPPADLLIAFWAGNADTTKELFERYLVSGSGRKPLVVYREKWLRKKGREPKFQGIERAENNKEKRWLLGTFKPVLRELQEAA